MWPNIGLRIAFTFQKGTFGNCSTLARSSRVLVYAFQPLSSARIRLKHNRIVELVYRPDVQRRPVCLRLAERISNEKGNHERIHTWSQGLGDRAS